MTAAHRTPVLPHARRRSLLAGLSLSLLGSTLVALPSAHAATITLTANDGAGTSSFVVDTLNRWSPAGAPTAGNVYVVPSGASQLSLRTPPDSGSVAFAGDELRLGSGAAGTFPGQLVIKNVTNTTVTIPLLTLANGRVQNGANVAGVATNITLASPNPINVASFSGAFDSGTNNRIINVSAPVNVASGASLISMSAGIINFSGGITGSGVVNFSAGTTTVTLPAGDFTNPLGTTGFTGNVSVIPQVANRSLNLGGAAAPITWGTAGFNPAAFTLNGLAGSSTLTVAHPLNLGGTVRTINTGNGSADVDAILGGGITATGAGGLVLAGAGRVSLPVAGDLPSTATVSLGVNQGPAVVRPDHDAAFGLATIAFDSAGNNTTSRLELIGGRTLNNPINLTARNNTSTAIQSLSGNNTLAGRVTLGIGGANFFFQSDAGSLVLSGASSIGGVAITAVSGNRIVSLLGAGNGAVTGVIENGTATSVGLAKLGGGVWTLGALNTYTGPTTVFGGTLVVDGSIAAGSAVSVSPAGTLAGIGSVLGNLTVDGTVAPGNSAGTLTVDGDLVLNPTAVLSFELSATNTTPGAGVNDLITGVNALTVDGILNITETVPGSFMSVTNASWQLINYSGALTNNLLTLGTLPAVQPGVEFSLDYSNEGRVMLVAAIPEPTSLAMLVLAAPLATRRRRA